jgi:asparagine synthase (glutamine-hydrolysing)
MCGIAGKVAAGEAVDPGLIERMGEELEHRGPDSRGRFIGDGVGLAVQRLRVIDLVTGDQPVFNEDGSVAVVLNGEIYNYRELREELSGRGHELSTETDTEVIAHLYEDHGVDCVHRLRGMFAFALWDQRGRRLVLARDRVGKKPLFYAERGGRLWFGSEPSAILADPDVPRDPDWPAIDRYLRYAYVPQPASGFTALRKLPPAHVAEWKDGRLSIARYWQLSFADGPAGAPAEQCERIRDALLEATRLRMRSDVPVGALLSGGIDSSAVVAAMSRTGASGLHTFSIGFDTDGYDETPHARAVAELYGTEHHECRLEPGDAEELLPMIVRHHGEPFADDSSIATFRLAELARGHVTVALNGDGGDESFAGYPRYRRAMRRLPGWAPARLAARRYGPHVSLLADSERDGLYEPAFRETLGPDRWLEPLEGLWRDSRAPSVLERMLDVDLQSYLPGDLLPKMDTATMAHSLEARSPFLDHVFLETAAALPAVAKLAAGRGKVLLKDAVADWLPPGLTERPKQGFSVPLADWFRGPLRQLPEDILLDPAAVERGIFRPARIRRMLAEHRLGAADHAAPLWALMVLETWQREFP